MAKKILTKQERNELIQRRENWQVFSNLLSKAISDLDRATKFEESCEIINNFIYLSRQLFRKQDEEINEIIDKLDKFIEDAQKKMYDLEQKSKPLIRKTIELYNSMYNGDLTFDNNVEQWFTRTFPLIVLYVNKNTNADNKSE